MYRAIVAARTRMVWRRVSEGDRDAPVRMASEDIRFEFVGHTPISTSFTGRDPFRAWLARVFDIFPDARFEVRDVAVRGWPWQTRVAVRLRITATLPDGTPYENQAAQWVTLRWGRMIDDWVLEDTDTLTHALATAPRA